MPDELPLAAKRAVLSGLARLVVKIGSGVLADASGLDRGTITRLAAEIAAVRARGLSVTVVSSGAIAAGRRVLGGKAPRSIPERQATAAVGQIDLMSQYRDAFARHGLTVAQVLLDAGDLADRQRYLNAEHTLATLHAKGVIPIVNENDTVAVDELKFGDNDNLSALVAILVGADLLIILSDVSALFTADPRVHPDARRIAVLAEVDAAALAATGQAGLLGTGGMRSKLLAAQKAAAGGIPTVIAGGREPGVLLHVLDPETDVGTLVQRGADRLAKRKHWIAYALPPRGALHCDAGAAGAVRAGGRSLLPSGVVSVSGQFAAGDCVRLLDPEGREFARGLSTYHAAEASRIAGRRSSEVEELLGYSLGDAVVHRDDLVLTEGTSKGGSHGGDHE